MRLRTYLRCRVPHPLRSLQRVGLDYYFGLKYSNPSSLFANDIANHCDNKRRLEPALSEVEGRDMS